MTLSPVEPSMRVGEDETKPFTLPWNTEWTMADAWGITERQCRNISYRTERLQRKTPRTNYSIRATSWSAEMVADLRAMWSAGVSCSHIAIQIGQGLTKNAIAGKVHRLGLPPRKYQAPRKVA